MNIEHITVLPAQDHASRFLWAEICVGHPNFKLLHDQNSGIYPAMNLGGNAAKGKYLVFWNSGERVTSSSEIQALLNLLKETNADQIITQGEIEWLPNHKQVEETYQTFIDGDSNGFISHQTYLMRTDIFKNIGGFSSSYRVAADTDLILRMKSHSLLVSHDVKPVFVQNSHFAQQNNRVGRFEILRINFIHGVRSQSFLRLINLLKFEYVTLRSSFSAAFETPTPDSQTKSALFNAKSKVDNCGRASVLNTFDLISRQVLSGITLKRIGIVGGSIHDPEVELLKGLFPNAIYESIGIDSVDHYLDLNFRQRNHVLRYDFVLASQVIEHVWNHETFFDNVVNLIADHGFVWLACPSSNKVHGSPDYFSAGLTHGYLSKNLVARGVKSITSGGFGTKRLYFATHLVPGWLTKRGHRFPLLYAFEDRNPFIRWVLRVRFLPTLLFLSVASAKPTSNSRWHTESWILAQK